MTSEAVDDHCAFYKSNISGSNSPVLEKERCDKERLLSHLSYGGILQSDVGCKIRIKHFDTQGMIAYAFLFILYSYELKVQLLYWIMK